MKSDTMTIRVYNNGCMDVELDSRTIYTKKENLAGWKKLAEMNNFELVHFKRFKNGDYTYWYN